MLQLPTTNTLSKRYVRVPVTGDTDPTDDTVSLAFIDAATDTDPTEDDWVAGDWDPNALGPTYKARAVIGPGATELAAGKYRVWLKFVDNPETPVEPVGYLVIE